MDLVYARLRPGGVPGRGDDRGRAGRGRGALHPGPAARGAGRPPDGQRPGPPTGRGRRAPSRRRLRRRDAGPIPRPAARRPGRPRGHGAGRQVGGAARRRRRRRPAWSRPTPGRRPDGGRHDRARPARGRSAIPAIRSPSTWWGSAGPGMSAIATALHAMGHTVTGSDLKASAVTERLRGAGMPVAIGHAAANVGAADVVTVSSAISEDNPEVVEARRRGITVLARAQALAVHRLAQALHRRGRDPREDHHGVDAGPPTGGGRDPGPRSSSAATSTRSAPTPSGTRGSGWWSRPTRATAPSSPSMPDVAVVTNVEADHLDHCGSFDAMRSAFEEFVAGARVRRVVGGDDPVAAEIGRVSGAEWSASRPSAPIRIVDLTLARSSISFGLVGPDGAGLGRLAVPVPGLHNARNAAVATVAALAAGVPFDGGGPGPVPVRRRGPTVRVPGRGQRGDLRRRLRPPAQRGARRPGRGPQRRLAADRGRVPAPPVQPHGGAGDRVRRRRSATPTWWWSPMSTGPVRPRCPESPAGWWPTPSAARCPAMPVLYAAGPLGPAAHGGRPARSRRPVLHAGRRGPHLAPRRAPVRPELVSGADDRSTDDLAALGRALGPGARATIPSAP